jgi:hypothetical protein
MDKETIKPATELSAAELRDLLAKKEKAEKAAHEKEKIEYEAARDETIFKMVNTAQTLFNELGEFKTFCHIEMENQAKKLEGYGKIRSNSKGGFSITNADDTMRVTRRRDTEPVWDERAGKGVDLIKDFLGDAIKKRDVKLYEILIGFLERNDKGDLEYARVMELYKHEDKFQDERWKEGLRLIKESFSNHLKGFGYEFKIKGTDGKWTNLLLNFSSI